MNIKTPQTEAPQGQTSNYLPQNRHEPIHSERLFQTGDEVVIAHAGEHYRLRRTRNGKLILTK
jgi:hemin uptake protein HemP